MYNYGDFEAFMQSITHSSMGGKNHCKHLGNGRVLQNCVALVNAYTLLCFGKELYTGNPKDFPVNSKTAQKGDVAIWDDHVAIVKDASKYQCLSSAYNGYFCKVQTYPNWQRANHKFRGFYHFPSANAPHDLNKYAKAVYDGKYGCDPQRTQKLRAEGLSIEECHEVQRLVDAMFKKK